MNKEPVALYIFRFVLGFGLFAFMCMLYWSSALLELDMKNLRSDIGQLRNDLYNLRTETHQIRDDVLKEIIQQQRNWQNLIKQTHASSIHLEGQQHTAENENQNKTVFNHRPHIDPSLPNLLQPDPFYEKVIQKLLGPDFKPQGTFQSASLGHYENLHPFSNWAEVSQWNEMCTVSVAKGLFGKFETMSPDMAIKMEARPMKDSDVPEFWIHLRDDVYWQPLRQELFPSEIELAPQFLRKSKVTAHDFKFYFDSVMNPYNQERGAVALRTYIGEIKEIEVIDDFTFVVRWNVEKVKGADGKMVPKIKYIAKVWTGALRPLASFVYKYFPDGKKIIEDDSDPNTYRNNSVWAQNFSQHWARHVIVSCGSWIFDGKTDREIRFKRNPDFYFPYVVLAEGMDIRFKESPDGIWQDFKENKLDSYSIQPDQFIELKTFLQSPEYQQQVKQGASIQRLDYVAMNYTYVGWNEAKPFFKNKKVRQALTMAIDRKRIIKQNLNGMGIEITGTFSPYSPDYDRSIIPWPYDPSEARRLLEEEGWFDNSGDGVRDKMIDGKLVSFVFNLTYYVKNPLSKAVAEYISTALKELGISCRLNGLDVADLSASVEDKSFDAILMAWTYGTPPEDPRQLWHSSGAKQKGSSNTIGFANAKIDQIIDQLDYEYDSQKRIGLYHQFCQIIHEEQPYTFLYTPKTAFLYRNYLKNVFIPADRQDLVPGANIPVPDSSVFWLDLRSH